MKDTGASVSAACKETQQFTVDNSYIYILIPEQLGSRGRQSAGARCHRGKMHRWGWRCYDGSNPTEGSTHLTSSTSEAYYCIMSLMCM